MHWEINVSQWGKHYFATHSRSIQSTEHAKTMVEDFKKRFPSSEGFVIQLTEWRTEGKVIK